MSIWCPPGVRSKWPGLCSVASSNIGLASTRSEPEFPRFRSSHPHPSACITGGVQFAAGSHGVELALPYDEPWGWMTPVAHALAALLLEQGHRDEAEAVYREDLERWPENLWSLQGLLAATELPGCCKRPKTTRDGERENFAARLATASARADTHPSHSCFCAGVQPPGATCTTAATASGRG